MWKANKPLGLPFDPEYENAIKKSKPNKLLKLLNKSDDENMQKNRDVSSLLEDSEDDEEEANKVEADYDALEENQVDVDSDSDAHEGKILLII